MSPTYAESTSVNSEQSRAEIERTLRRYGAEGFAYGWQATAAMVAFQMRERQVKFMLPMPDPADREFRFTKARRQRRSDKATEEAYEQAVRQRWRALNLVIKAKLEAVEAGIEEFDSAFMAQIVLPDGTTVGETMLPQVKRAYETGTMPPMLPQLGSGEETP